MKTLEIKDEQVVTVDIHKFSICEAKRYLERLLIALDLDIKEVVVIHGWRRGNALLSMVRNDLRSNRIKRRFLSLNPGVTSLILK